MNRYTTKRSYRIPVDEETYRRLEAYAKEQGVTVKAVVEAAVHDVGRKDD